MSITEAEYYNFFHTNNRPPAVAMFDTVKIYDNNNQMRVASDVLTFLYAVANRDQDPILEQDGARGALVAALKFTIGDMYKRNKRQFTKEDKEKILQDMSKIIDTQLDSMHLQQVLAH